MAFKAELLARIEAEQALWREMVAEVGQERMERPGPMGAWTFKDLAAHLTGWRERTIGRLEAGAGADPPPPWPPELTTDDVVNDWIYARRRDRPLLAVLDEAGASFTRLAAAIKALPEADVTTPGRFAWLEGARVADADFFGHFHDEHEGDVRAWLARS